MEKDPVEIIKIYPMQSASLIVGWQTQDVGRLGASTIEFLVEKLDAQKSAKIRPFGFFPLGGVRFKDDVIRLHEGSIWACQELNLLIFTGDEPVFEHQLFINVLLDFAQKNYDAKEIYTINGTVSMIPHTQPRRLYAVYNEPHIRKNLRQYGLMDLSWEGTPATSSYLLWLASRRGMPGVSLWPEVPFYLAAAEDPQATRAALSFLNKRFSLGLDLGMLDAKISEQNERIARAREQNKDLNKYLNMLERGLSLNEEEQLKVTKEIYNLLKMDIYLL